MKQTEIVTGFSELKELLVHTYKIDRSREKIRLYFTECENQIFLHDYHNHKNKIILVPNVRNKEIVQILVGQDRKICLESLEHSKPAEFLNARFLLYGFFRF